MPYFCVAVKPEQQVVHAAFRPDLISCVRLEWNLTESGRSLSHPLLEGKNIQNVVIYA